MRAQGAKEGGKVEARPRLAWGSAWDIIRVIGRMLPPHVRDGVSRQGKGERERERERGPEFPLLP